MTDTPQINSTDKLFVVLSHLSGFLGVPLLLPLVVYLVKKDDESSYVAENAKEALNFHISLLIYGIVSAILMIVIIGFVLLGLLAFFYLVCSIVAAIKGSEGKVYRYPLTIRLVK